MRLKWLIFFSLFILTLGILFRFSNLGAKFYWGDEVATSLVISGHTPTEIRQEIYNTDGPIGVQDLTKYQELTASNDWLDSVAFLAQDDPQHTPIYYVIARFWAQAFGTSPSIIRSLSVVISLLVFPCIYWLSGLLFEEKMVGWVAVLITAVSPFHLAYAQEARPYTLFIVITLMSCITLLRAMKSQTVFKWGAYVLSGTACLYTSLFGVFVLLAHAAYVLMLQGTKLTQKTINYLGSCCAIALLFSPWVFVILNNASEDNTAANWLARDTSLVEFLIELASSLTRYTAYIFYKAGDSIVLDFAYLLIFILVIYSFFYLYKKTPKSTWLFLFTLAIFTALPLILIDIFLGMKISTINRYLIPTYLGIQLSVSYFISTQIKTQDGSRNWRPKFWSAILALIVLLGIRSSVAYISTENVWNKGGYTSVYMSEVINQSGAPVILSDVEPYKTIALANILRPEAKFYLLDDFEGLDWKNLSQNFSDVFLWPNFENEMQANVPSVYRVEIGIRPIPLWKMRQ